MNTAITILVVLFFIICFSIIRNYIVYYDLDINLPAELYDVKWDNEKCKYYLQAKLKWCLRYRICYWKIEECDGNEYYRVESNNVDDLYNSLVKKDEMVVFILWHRVPIKLGKKNGEKDC